MAFSFDEQKSSQQAGAKPTMPLPAKKKKTPQKAPLSMQGLQQAMGGKGC